MKILAIDPASHVGWCYHDGTCIIHGVWDCTVKRDESDGMRLIRFKTKLEEFATLGLDLIVFEAVRHANPKMIRGVITQSEIQGILKCWCNEKGIQYCGLSPSEIKKHISGKGNANKVLVMESVNEKYGLSIKDDNEADAIAIMSFALHNYSTGKEMKNDVDVN
jgi:Holliday junction resolvasome RuvABC endonuclease subunit